MTKALPEDRPSVEQLSAQLQSAYLPSPPQLWLDWLSKTRQIRPVTIKLYSHHISQFFAFAAILFPSRRPNLILAWNVPFCREFFEVIRGIVCPSTFQNYHSSLRSARRFMSKSGIRPENHADIEDEFSDMRAAGERKKKKYLKNRKSALKNAGVNLVRQFYREVVHNDFFWRTFEAMVNRTQKALMRKKKVPKFSAGHTFFANAFLIAQIQSSNFKRVGNFAEIKCDEARKELQHVIDKFENKFPGREFSSNTRRLDRRYCVPAVLRAEDGRKKGETEWFAILDPQIVLALFLYIDYIRPYGKKAPKTDALFVNSLGEGLGYDCSR